MNKVMIFFILIILTSQNIISKELQLSPPILLTTPFDPRANESLCICDLDGDNDLDIVATDYSGDAIMPNANPVLIWFQNIDGKGNFNRKVINTGNLKAGVCLYIADLDSDDDPDIILGACTGENSITWFENKDGKGDFGPQKVIKSSMGHHVCTFAADFDGDNDMDILDPDWDGFEYYENKDGKGSFEKKIINDLLPTSLLALDIGKDNNLDILASFENQIVWFENNDGKASFSNQKVISWQGSGSLHLADLDKDGDLDLFSAGRNKVMWFENTNGEGLFGYPSTITQSLDNVYAVCTADLDLDGDLDVLSGSYGDSVIAWYENTNGEGSFGPKQSINHPFGRVAAVHTNDLDGDGDKDILVSTEGNIFWLKNIINISAINDYESDLVINFKLLQNYPNPFNPNTTIKYHLTESNHITLTIFNLYGQKIETLVNVFQTAGEHEITWQPKGLSSGIYFYRLQAGEYTETKKLILTR